MIQNVKELRLTRQVLVSHILSSNTQWIQMIEQKMKKEREIHQENESERFCVATREAEEDLHGGNPPSLVASEEKADERRESLDLVEDEANWRVFLAQVAAMSCALQEESHFFTRRPLLTILKCKSHTRKSQCWDF